MRASISAAKRSDRVGPALVLGQKRAGGGEGFILRAGPGRCRPPGPGLTSTSSGGEASAAQRERLPMVSVPSRARTPCTTTSAGVHLERQFLHTDARLGVARQNRRPSAVKGPATREAGTDMDIEPPRGKAPGTADRNAPRRRS